MWGGPHARDWDLREILVDDAKRGTDLGRMEPAESLVRNLVDIAKEAVQRSEVRIGIDSKRNEWRAKRVTIQFQVPTRTFDWFFNARTGYRAQFWLSVENGTQFNLQITKELEDAIVAALPPVIVARKILVFASKKFREERDNGACEVDRDFVMQSLHPFFSKIWICERLIQQDGSDPKELGVLLSAIRMPKLCITRWDDAINPETGERGEGLRAPLPEKSLAWLDLKGGFVEQGAICQIKTPEKRAKDLYERGWT